MRVLTEKLDEIEIAASAFPATSATGAMFHLCLIKDAADLLSSWVPEESERKSECDKAETAIKRMCYSIRDFIVSITDASPDDGCGEYFMSEKYNPHRLSAEAIAHKDDADASA
ncbi:hypothetical protein QM467_18610 [Rhodoblastus sp. 17X3]|uniref:hypothetical protein n=1 Tax=Rhodoblastus sp. 17X3 TaxID=3047026 RepID=UPI0024B726D4|nr:hypothetical protein [Rhodoblastus sp. 17X3]MDI9850051.1 hypothetical protein [Rhodoblastus sp. 17X3]